MDEPARQNGAGDPHIDDALVENLRQYDERLRSGETPAAPAEDLSNESPAAIESYLECLHALERLWPRSKPASGGVAIPERLGRFRIERVVGQGGFGIVYLAHDPKLGRQVALKVPRLHTLLAPGMLERFQREARAAAALDHPQIVPVHDAGEADGLCYIVSAYCPGPTLATWLRERCPAGTTARHAADIVGMLADAVAYSHAHGILHRDIKPGNVLLFPTRSSDSATEPSRDGLPFVPRLGDFGLAKIVQDALEAASSQAETDGNAALGTPSYMAPEQFDSSPIGPETDVYGLGAVLYELLVGRPPFQGLSTVDVLDQVRTSEPVPVRKLRRDVPRDLETICLKCLEKSPVRRYPTADDLRDDLQRFLAGRTIKARPPGWADAVAKSMRRHPAITLLLATVTVFVVGMAIRESGHAARLETKNDELRGALRRAIASEDEARGIAYALNINAAWRAREAGDFVEFSRIVDRYRDGQELAEYRGIEWHYLERLTRTSQRTWLELETPTYDIVPGPSGQVALVGEDAVVRLMDGQSGGLVASWPTGQIEVNSACFLPDGRSLWTAGDDGTLREWDLATHQELRRIDAHPDAKAFKVKHLAQRNLLLSCGTDGPIRLWDLQNGGTPAGSLEGHTDWVQDVVLLRDGQRVVSASDDETVRMWDVDSKQQVWRHGAGEFKFRDLALSPDGRHFAASGKRLQLFSTESLALELDLTLVDEARLVCFGGDSGRIYVADRMGIIHVFRLVQDDASRIIAAEPVFQWRAHSGGVYSVQLSADGESILTAGRDGVVADWKQPGQSAQPRLFTDPDIVWSSAFAPSSRWLAVGSMRRLSIHDLQQPDKRPMVLADTGDWTTAVDVDPTGSLIAAGSNTGEVSLWNSEGVRLRQLTDAEGIGGGGAAGTRREIAELSFSRDGAALAVADKDLPDIHVFDVGTGARLKQFSVGSARSVQFSPAEDVLAASTADHRIELWHWPTGASLWKSERYPERPVWIRFLPNGQTILAETGDRTVRVFDRASGKVIRDMSQHRAGIDCMDVSPDGRTIATKDSEGWLNLWHAESGQLLFSLPSDRGGGDVSVSFSPDGHWLAYRAKLNEVRLLPMHP